MIKLGLIGSNISHSKSPSIYNEILNIEHSYELLDYKLSSDLPPISDLDEYYGLNITSPFKKSFLSQLHSYPKHWGAVNCLRNMNGIWVGTNTDATALEELIPEMNNQYQINSWVILGDGAMGEVVKIILQNNNLPYQQYSRRMGDDFNQFSFFKKLNKDDRLCIINACSRELVISGSLSKEWVFWDFNYLHTQHSESIPRNVMKYIDGESLLITQAKHAVKFWELT